MMSGGVSNNRVGGAYVMNETQSHNTSVKVTAAPISPTEASDYRRQTKRKGEYQIEVSIMLPLDDCILGQVRHV